LGTGTLALGAQGSPAAEISTPDDQALVTFLAAVIAPRSGDTSVKVTVAPLDAGSIAPAITGQTFDSNGYRIDAVYATSGEPVVLTDPVTVVLRYAAHSPQMLRNQDKAWLALPGTRFDGTQQLLAASPRLGVFVAAAGARRARGAPGGPAGAPVAAGAGGITAVLGRWFMPPRGRRGSGGEQRAAGVIIRVRWIELCRRNRG